MDGHVDPLPRHREVQQGELHTPLEVQVNITVHSAAPKGAPSRGPEAARTSRAASARSDPRAERATRGWARLIWIALRIRSLQRIWAHLGRFLQEAAGSHIRERLRALYRP